MLRFGNPLRTFSVRLQVQGQVGARLKAAPQRTRKGRASGDDGSRRGGHSPQPLRQFSLWLPLVEACVGQRCARGTRSVWSDLYCFAWVKSTNRAILLKLSDIANSRYRKWFRTARKAQTGAMIKHWIICGCLSCRHVHTA